MAIRKIYFQIPDKSSNYSHNSDFLFETYYITEYFSREISKHDFKYKNVTRLLIYLDSKSFSIEYCEIFKNLKCYLPDDYQNLVPLSGKDRTEKILEYLLLAVSLADVNLPGILEVTKQTVLKFRNDLYSNRWLFNQRTIKNLGKVGLECELDKDKFSLYFFLKVKNKEIYKKTILETKPDSLCYHYQFNKLVIEDDYILVPTRFFYIRDNKYQYFSEKFPNVLYKISLVEIEDIFNINVIH